MRFVLSVAFKYLIPRFRQISVSIISLISVLVISLVVWLVIVFLSVTDGIEKKWIKQLVTLNSPIRVIPTDEYYKSYYYKIDSLSSDSGYATKTIGEKFLSSRADPYDPTIDAEIPSDFPLPDKTVEGNLKDLVKEVWSAAESLKNARVQEYEVSFGNLRLSLLRQDPSGDLTQTFLSQVSYIASLDSGNTQFQKLLLAPSVDDFNNLLKTLSLSGTLQLRDGGAAGDEKSVTEAIDSFFKNVEITQLKTSDQGYRLPRTLFPENGSVKACGIVKNGKVVKAILPKDEARLQQLKRAYSGFGHEVLLGKVDFEEGRPVFTSFDATTAEISRKIDIFLEPDVFFNAQLLTDSLQSSFLNTIQFQVNTTIQDLTFEGVVRYEDLEISQAFPSQTLNSALWVYQQNGKITLPQGRSLGEGILIAKTYRENDVKLGDTGFISYYSQTASGTQEQRLPVFVAGFYDPGFMPVGNKVVLVDPSVLGSLRANASVPDKMLGNGLHVWIPKIEEAASIKAALKKTLEERGVAKYWSVESFEDYEFAKPVLQQLKSDKTLFTLIAFIILIVACSNVISMLILLVNDKKKEIGILQSLGASSYRIASIFGVCGFFTGLVSSIIGTLAALLTLSNLQGLINLLSFLQGHQAFQAAFYGELLPNQVSLSALIFVLIATTLISLLAGIAPAIKAARIRPTEILRSE